MPISNPHNLSFVGESIIFYKPVSILDIGAGFGCMGVVARQYTDVIQAERKPDRYRNWETRIDAVEIYGWYIADLQKKIYDHIYQGDILKIVDELDDYRMILMIDVIEHLDKKDGKVLLNKLRKKCRTLLVTTPSGFRDQGFVFGNKAEAHKCSWEAEDFKGAKSIDVAGGQIQVVYDKESEK